jgi:hypothetical protein
MTTSTSSKMYQQIMDNKEPASLAVHVKFDIIRSIYINKYDFDQKQLFFKSNIILNKVIIVHKVLLLPHDLLGFIKSFLFTKGSLIQEQILKNQKRHKFKLRSLTNDLLDELIIYQNILW